MEETMRNLSGIFIRDKGTTVCFEEASEEAKDKFLDSLDKKGVEKLAKMLANNLVEIGNEFDIARSI